MSIEWCMVVSMDDIRMWEKSQGEILWFKKVLVYAWLTGFRKDVSRYSTNHSTHIEMNKMREIMIVGFTLDFWVLGVND